MTSDELARAGEPFFTTKAAGVGTGLGLFVARSSVDQLGGTPDADVPGGAGHYRRRSLPRSVTRPDARLVNDRPLLLVVEDDDALRSDWRGAFERRGFEVRAGDDGRGCSCRRVEDPPEFVVAGLAHAWRKRTGPDSAFSRSIRPLGLWS